MQITDPKGRRHTVSLVAGKQFHTHQGAVEHDDLIGHPEGIVVTSTGGTAYLAFRPLLSDFVLSMPRGAAVVYPKDAAMIVGYADMFPGRAGHRSGGGLGRAELLVAARGRRRPAPCIPSSGAPILPPSRRRT